MATEYGSLPFAEAIEYLRRKVNLPTEHWDDILGAAHDRYFMVAGAAKADLLSDLHEAVRKGIEDGTTLEEFRRDFDKLVYKNGWTGFTGEDTPGGLAWRTNVIYSTNLRTAYQAGRFAQHREGAADRPYLQYNHSDGVEHPRPLHQSWDGTILAASDPWWDTHYTPNGWGCRCYITSLAPRDLKRLGKDGPDPTPDDGTYVHKDRNGVEHELPAGVDYGWAHAPGQTRDLVRELEGKAAKLPGQIGDDLRLDISAKGANISIERGGTPQAPTTGDNPMTTVIYQDDARTLSYKDGLLLIDNKAGRKTVTLDRAEVVDVLPADVQKALRAAKQDPTGWFGLRTGSQISAVFPPQTRGPVLDAISKAKAAAKAIEDEINSPAAKALRKVRDLQARAERLIDNPGEYFGAKAAADKALVKWQQDFPIEAAAARRQAIIDQAQDLERKAKDALLYDADGMLDEAARQARHDELMRQAKDLRASAGAQQAQSAMPAQTKRIGYQPTAAEVERMLAEQVRLADASGINPDAVRKSLERGLVMGDTINIPAGGYQVRVGDGVLEQIKEGKVVKTVPMTDDAAAKILQVKALHDGRLGA